MQANKGEFFVKFLHFKYHNDLLGRFEIHEFFQDISQTAKLIVFKNRRQFCYSIAQRLKF
jgi:hypothetical protein